MYVSAACVDILPVLFRLKRKLQRKLDLTWITSCRQKSKLWRPKGCGVDRILRSGFGKLQVGMIEYVEKFSTEFQFCALGDCEILEQREVPYLIARALHSVPANVTERPQSGIRKRTGVKERSGKARSRFQVADKIGTLLSVGISHSVGVENCEPVAGGDRRNTTDLPASNDLVTHSARITKYGLAVAQGQFVEVTKYKAMADVEISVSILPFRVDEVAEVATILRA